MRRPSGDSGVGRRVQMRETRKHFVARRLQCVDAQIDRSPRGEGAHLGDGILPEDGSQGWFQPLRKITRNKTGRAAQIALGKTIGFPFIEGSRRMRLARTERHQRIGVHAARPGKRAENNRARRFAAHEECGGGPVALRVENQRSDRRAILGAREAVRQPPILQRIGGRSFARIDVVQNFNRR